jgi:hypothetical protein
LANLIVSSMQEHFCLVEGVSDEDASYVFNNAAHRVIKDAFKHVRCQSITYYCTHVLKREMWNSVAQDLHQAKEEYLQWKVD